MKTIIVYLLTAITLVGVLNACGPSEEEKRAQREKARQDSLERVRQQQLQQQRLDSIRKAQAKADSIEAQKQQEEAKKERRRQISYNKTGPFAIQVEAWRSQEKAEGQVSKWKERGFENAYVVKHGKEETGDVWFRVRLGRVASKTMADRVGNNLTDEYGEKYWIAMVQDESEEENKSGPIDD